MIKLYQFAPAWDVPNVSPFCVKIESYLKMAGLQRLIENHLCWAFVFAR